MSNYKYINPFTDFGFKKIFGEEANKDLLINFLNELLAYENQEIKELTFNKNEQIPENKDLRKVVYDLFCENEKGEKFIVEMQKAMHSFFKDRMIFYSTFPIREQAPKGKIITETNKKVDWTFELKAVYVIALLNFKMPIKGNCNGKLLTQSKIMDIEEHSIFYDKLTFITIELPYFNKTIDELESNFDKWIYVLKNLDSFERIPEKIKDKIFEKLFSAAEYANLNHHEQLAYELSLSYYRDLYSVIDSAKDEVKEIYSKMVEQERIEKEEAKQREKEAKQKEKEAKQREAIERKEKEEAKQKEKEAKQREKEALNREKETIINLHKTGMSIEQIVAIVNKTEEEIRKILNI